VTPAETRFPSADGTLSLHAHAWPADAPEALLVLCHGMGEHLGRYAQLAGELAAQRVTTFAFDQRGHGRSGGGRGHVDRFALLLDDLDRAVAEGRARFPGLPLFVMGHSFGGLVALRWLQTRASAVPLRGAILSSPLLGVALQPPAWKVALSGALSRWAPALPFANEIDPAELSRDDAYVKAYRDDPLVHNRITPRMYTEMMAAADAAAREPLPSVPLLFLVPGQDRIVAPEPTLRLVSSLTGDVTLRHYPDARHESFNDLGRAAVVADIAGWLRSQR
jgi:alpha-beta hydrolase superfamily lysophospholipase